jgi:hypothetical protein
LKTCDTSVLLLKNLSGSVCFCSLFSRSQCVTQHRCRRAAEGAAAQRRWPGRQQGRLRHAVARAQQQPLRVHLQQWHGRCWVCDRGCANGGFVKQGCGLLLLMSHTYGVRWSEPSASLKHGGGCMVQQFDCLSYPRGCMAELVCCGMSTGGMACRRGGQALSAGRRRPATPTSSRPSTGSSSRSWTQVR